jgi:phenylalanyl-tRNA synthetase alpha subunit
MKNTILFTPSNEQLVEIANQDPELHSRIKDAILKNLQTSATKFISSKLKSKANQVYENIYNNVEKKLFRNSDYWGKNPASFSTDLEKSFSEQIEKRLKSDLQAEFEATFESIEFKNLLKSKIKERMLAAVLKNLDTKIQEEAKKLIA